MLTKMNHPWFNKNLKCVVLCGGTGSRLLPLSLEKQKGMIEVASQPIIKYIIDYWKQFTNEFIFIVKYKKEELIEYLKTLPVNSTFIELQELKGIGDGLLEVENIINDNFITVLGDCYCKGTFNFPENFDQGVGVWPAELDDDIKRSYSIELNNGQIHEVIEKPKQLLNNFCGMGFYFFKPKVFNYIKKSPPDSDGRRGITEVIQLMIDNGEIVKPLNFQGDYLNITYQEDVKRLEKLIN